MKENIKLWTINIENWKISQAIGPIKNLITCNIPEHAKKIDDPSWMFQPHAKLTYTNYRCLPIRDIYQHSIQDTWLCILFRTTWYSIRFTFKITYTFTFICFVFILPTIGNLKKNNREKHNLKTLLLIYQLILI